MVVDKSSGGGAKWTRGAQNNFSQQGDGHGQRYATNHWSQLIQYLKVIAQNLFTFRPDKKIKLVHATVLSSRSCFPRWSKCFLIELKQVTPIGISGRVTEWNRYWQRDGWFICLFSSPQHHNIQSSPVIWIIPKNTAHAKNGAGAALFAMVRIARIIYASQLPYQKY